MARPAFNPTRADFDAGRAVRFRIDQGPFKPPKVRNGTLTRPDRVTPDKRVIVTDERGYGYSMYLEECEWVDPPAQPSAL